MTSLVGRGRQLMLGRRLGLLDLDLRREQEVRRPGEEVGIILELPREDLRQGDEENEPRTAEEYVCTNCNNGRESTWSRYRSPQETERGSVARVFQHSPAAFQSNQTRNVGIAEWRKGPPGRKLLATPAASEGPRRRKTQGPPASLPLPSCSPCPGPGPCLTLRLVCLGPGLRPG